MLVELLPSFSLHDTVATTPTTDKSKVTTDNPFIQIEILHTEKRKSTSSTNTKNHTKLSTMLNVVLDIRCCFNDYDVLLIFLKEKNN